MFQSLPIEVVLECMVLCFKLIGARFELFGVHRRAAVHWRSSKQMSCWSERSPRYHGEILVILVATAGEVLTSMMSFFLADSTNKYHKWLEPGWIRTEPKSRHSHIDMLIFRAKPASPLRLR